MSYPRERRKPVQPTALPPEAVPATTHRDSRKYLLGRGLSSEEIEAYNLHYCAGGAWGHRIIIPMYDRNEQLLAYQGRSIDNAEPRYRTEGPRPLYIPEYTVARSTLVVVEGPFDAVAAGRVLPAVATLGILPSQDQIDQLLSFVRLTQIDQILIWYDAAALAEAFSLQLRLHPFLPTRVIEWAATKDPGECDVEQVRQAIFSDP